MGNTNFKFNPPSQKPLYWSLTKLVKSITSVTLGCIIGVIPAIVAISAISIITIFRWPVNIYFSLKFVALTPILKLDLRILIFFLFPILHSILPVLFFTFSCFAAVVYSVSATYWPLASLPALFLQQSQIVQIVYKTTQTLSPYIKTDQNFVKL